MTTSNQTMTLARASFKDNGGGPGFAISQQVFWRTVMSERMSIGGGAMVALWWIFVISGSGHAQVQPKKVSVQHRVLGAFTGSAVAAIGVGGAVVNSSVAYALITAGGPLWAIIASCAIAVCSVALIGLGCALLYDSIFAKGKLISKMIPAKK